MVEQRGAADQPRRTIDLAVPIDSERGSLPFDRHHAAHCSCAIRVLHEVETGRREAPRSKKTLTIKKIVCYIFHS